MSNELLVSHTTGTTVYAAMRMQLLHVTNNDAKYVDIQFGIHGYPS